MSDSYRNPVILYNHGMDSFSGIIPYLISCPPFYFRFLNESTSTASTYFTCGDKHRTWLPVFASNNLASVFSLSTLLLYRKTLILFKACPEQSGHELNCSLELWRSTQAIPTLPFPLSTVDLDVTIRPQGTNRPLCHYYFTPGRETRLLLIFSRDELSPSAEHKGLQD